MSISIVLVLLSLKSFVPQVLAFATQRASEEDARELKQLSSLIGLKYKPSGKKKQRTAQTYSCWMLSQKSDDSHKKLNGREIQTFCASCGVDEAKKQFAKILHLSEDLKNIHCNLAEKKPSSSGLPDTIHFGDGLSFDRAEICKAYWTAIGDSLDGSYQGINEVLSKFNPKWMSEFFEMNKKQPKYTGCPDSKSTIRQRLTIHRHTIMEFLVGNISGKGLMAGMDYQLRDKTGQQLPNPATLCADIDELKVQEIHQRAKIVRKNPEEMKKLQINMIDAFLKEEISKVEDGSVKKYKASKLLEQSLVLPESLVKHAQECAPEVYSEFVKNQRKVEMSGEALLEEEKAAKTDYAASFESANKSEN